MSDGKCVDGQIMFISHLERKLILSNWWYNPNYLRNQQCYIL